MAEQQARRPAPDDRYVRFHALNCSSSAASTR
jgi:hypothetical protein